MVNQFFSKDQKLGFRKKLFKYNANSGNEYIRAKLKKEEVLEGQGHEIFIINLFDEDRGVWRNVVA